MPDALVSILILNYNGKCYLEKCLPSVLQTNYKNIEIIIIDNASADGSLEFLNRVSSDKRIHVLRNKVNLGFAGGLNIGISLAQGEYLVFLNNDTVVEPGWVEELIKAMESDLLIGAAQSKLLLLDSPNKLDSAGNFSNFYGDTFARGLGEEDVGKYQYDEIFSCKGASMIVRRSVLDEVGLFDSDYFVYYEDTDLCWRMRLAGYKIMFVPSSIVYHKGGGSIPTLGAPSYFFNVYLMKRNRISALLKNYEITNVIKYLLPNLVYETTRIVTVGLEDLSKRQDFSYSLAAGKAILWNLWHFKRIWNKRVLVQSVRCVSDREIMGKMKIG